MAVYTKRKVVDIDVNSTTPIYLKFPMQTTFGEFSGSSINKINKTIPVWSIPISQRDPHANVLGTGDIPCSDFKLYTDNVENYIIIPFENLSIVYNTYDAKLEIKDPSVLQGLNVGQIRVQYTLTINKNYLTFDLTTDNYIPNTLNTVCDINALNISRMREEITGLKEAVKNVDTTAISNDINTIKQQIAPVIMTQEEYDQLGTYENKLYYITEE